MSVLQMLSTHRHLQLTELRVLAAELDVLAQSKTVTEPVTSQLAFKAAAELRAWRLVILLMACDEDVAVIEIAVHQTAPVHVGQNPLDPAQQRQQPVTPSPWMTPGASQGVSHGTQPPVSASPLPTRRPSIEAIVGRNRGPRPPAGPRQPE